MKQIAYKSLIKLIYKLFVYCGATKENAKIITMHLIENHLLGYDSHGAIRLSQYLTEDLKNGYLKLKSKPKLKKIQGNTALLDAEFSPGPVAGTIAMQKAVELAIQYGTGIVGINNTHHLIRLGAYPTIASEFGMIGIACASGKTQGVAPYGGKEGRLHTNPIAFACPRGKKYPFLVDMATSSVSGGKINLARNENKLIPEGWIINSKGKVSIDPNDFFNGGFLLPLGGGSGYKGFALSLIVEILAGIITRNKIVAEKPKTLFGQGLFLIAINIGHFIDVNMFKEKIETLFNHIKNTPTLDGFDKILIPGERAYREKEIRQIKGIPIDEKTYLMLKNISNEKGIDVNTILEFVS